MGFRIEPRWRGALALLVAHAIIAWALPVLAAESGGRGIPDKAEVETLEDGLAILRFERSIESERTIEALRVRNPWGDVRVRRAPVNAVGLSFVVQRLSGVSPLPNIEAAARGSRVEVRVDYPGDPKRVSRGGERPGRVDLVVFAPATAAIDVETDDGELRVAHTGMPIRARSASGRILVSGASTLDLESVDGAVLARQVGGVSGTSRVRSDRGAVTVLISPTGDQRIRVRAGTGVLEGPGWAEGEVPGLGPGVTRWERRYGKGRHRFEIESTRGEVHLMPFIALDDVAIPDDADAAPVR